MTDLDSQVQHAPPSDGGEVTPGAKGTVKPPPSRAPSATGGRATWVVAVTVLVGYAVLLAVMARAADGNWDRLNYLFDGGEAITFTAVGWLFTDTVRRSELKRAHGQVDEAGKAADRERARADSNEADALVGRGLEAATRVRADAALSRRPDVPWSDGRAGVRPSQQDTPEATPGDIALVELVALADALRGGSLDTRS